MSTDIDKLKSRANAWTSLDNWFTRKAKVDPLFKLLVAQVSNELFENGCHSAYIHRVTVVEKLLERVAELEDEIKYLEASSK